MNNTIAAATLWRTCATAVAGYRRNIPPDAQALMRDVDGASVRKSLRKTT